MPETEKQSSLTPLIRWLLEPGLAVFIGYLFYYFKRHPESAEKDLAEAALTSVAAFLMAELLRRSLALGQIAKRFEVKIENMLGKFTAVEGQVFRMQEQIISDERIIYAREEPQRRAKVAVIGIETYELNLNKHRFDPQCESDKWRNSISILKFDRIQDLLFSKAYLEHFFSLRRKSVAQKRILIVNDIPRSAEAVQSFLQISKELGISTYIYKKSEFHQMIENLSELITEIDDLSTMRSILKGNPELNLMVDEPRQLQEWKHSFPVSTNQDYLLRYLLVEQNSDVITRRPGDHANEIPISYKHIERLFKIMHAALQPARGEEVFDAIYKNQQLTENYWSRANLGLLKATWK
jgi:hypothetical protein